MSSSPLISTSLLMTTICFSVCRGEVGLFRTQFNEYMLAFIFLYEYGICLLICIGKVGLLPLPLGAKLELAGKMRCCCFAHWAGPKLDSCPVFSYSHARECELHFFSSKNPMCSVVLYYSHGNKKNYFKFYSISWRGMLTIR